MDINVFQAVITAVSTVGFPMAVAVHYMTIGYKRTKENTEAVKEHTKAIEAMAVIISSNTETMKLLHNRKD